MKTISYLSIVLLILASSSLLKAQDTLNLVLDFEVSRVSLDQKSNVLLANRDGQVHKYDAEGKLLWNYSPPKIGEVHHVEAWASMKILVFYRDFQEFVWLDRFLTETSRRDFPNELIGFAQQISLSADGALWIFDNLDFSLKKYQANSRQLLINTPLDLLLDSQSYDILFMREYQGQLFICDKHAGILVFDNMGNYRKTLPYPNQSFLGFEANRLYGLQDDSLFYFEIYLLEETLIPLPKPLRQSQFFIDTGKTKWFITDKEVQIIKH